MSVNPPGELPPDPLRPPPHAEMREGGEPQGPIEPGLGPPHMREPHHPGHHHERPHAPIEPGLGPPHEEMPEPPEPPIPPPPPPGPEPVPGEPQPGAPVEPGLGPPHMREPHPPGHPGHEHHPHEDEPHAPIEPGLGPPHAELPPLPPRPGEAPGGGEAERPPARPDNYTPPEPPALPPWLRAEPIGAAPAASTEAGATGAAAPGAATAAGAGAAAAAQTTATTASTDPAPFAPPGSPGRVDAAYPEPFTPPASAPTAPPPAPAGSEASLLTPVATTPAEPAAIATAAPPRVFGETLATGVLLTLAGGSAIFGGIFALFVTDAFGFTVKAVISGGIALALLLGAVALRLVRHSDDLRGLLAVAGIGFAAASLAFAYDTVGATDHDNLVKFALVAGLVAVLGWLAAIIVPSAVAGFLAVVALATAVARGVLLALESPTQVEIFVAALGIGIAVAALLPRLAMLRPHPMGLGWALAGAALVMTVPAVELISRGDATALAAGATASAGMLALATRHRHLPAAIGALAGLAALEGYLVSNYVTQSGSGAVDITRLVLVAVAGAVLIALVAAGVLITARGRALPHWPLPLGPADILLAASLALAVISLFSGPGDTPLHITIPGFSTSTSAT